MSDANEIDSVSREFQALVSASRSAHQAYEAYKGSPERRTDFVRVEYFERMARIHPDGNYLNGNPSLNTPERRAVYQAFITRDKAERQFEQAVLATGNKEEAARNITDQVEQISKRGAVALPSDIRLLSNPDKKLSDWFAEAEQQMSVRPNSASAPAASAPAASAPAAAAPAAAAPAAAAPAAAAPAAAAPAATAPAVGSAVTLKSGQSLSALVLKNEELMALGEKLFPGMDKRLQAYQIAVIIADQNGIEKPDDVRAGNTITIKSATEIENGLKTKFKCATEAAAPLCAVQYRGNEHETVGALLNGLQRRPTPAAARSASSPAAGG